MHISKLLGRLPSGYSGWRNSAVQGAYGDRGWEISPPNIDWPGGAIEAGWNGETIIKIIF
ncbi:hypothetical protein [Burkholderia thailandensis]|nr:hypothetical protein [Burkholderia thailandensis]MCS6469954.1 hypothetical protein [Burkholderia thailandensis]MCS6475772.1 hypothetical protein [Burkholderia thailandensis]MCS6494028.1 hypothetical protein [Burkholderia thailandensis]MCS6506620.1 hypothetical protein [Burkholderia thailandensis]MCS6511352.1 hypothetical protein [Burkholderia thailandensis]